MIDLHVHSNRSDGTLSPTELVDYAIEKKLSAFALTDHDTVDGLDEALSYAQKLRKEGVPNVPEVIPGIELSTEKNGKEVHVVGLYINKDNAEFKKYLSDFVESREARNAKMCEKLCEHGVPISYEELKEAFPGAIITRAHFAKHMLAKGYVRSLKEAFDRYIGDNGPCFLSREKVTPEQAVRLILSADGIPVFAHPVLCKVSDSVLEEFTASLKDEGLIGIEAFYSTYSPSDERHIQALAAKYNLLLSGGSDFHGTNKDGIDLGVGYGKLYVHGELLEKIKSASKNLLFTDLDGTLFKKDSTISAEMHEALKKLTKAGHRFVICSGRPLPSIKERIELLDMKFENMYAVANNGALIYDVSGQKNIYEKKLPSDIIRQVCDICNEAGVHVHCYTDKEIVGYSEDKELEFYLRRIHMPFIRTDDIAGYLSEGTYKIQIIDLDNKQTLDNLREEILCKLGESVDAVFSNDRYLEILPKGISKGASVKWLSSYLSMPLSHTYAAGDDENDISMIEAAKVGIAMINANEKTKAVADIVTTFDNDHDGLIEIIHKYFN